MIGNCDYELKVILKNFYNAYNNCTDYNEQDDIVKLYRDVIKKQIEIPFGTVYTIDDFIRRIKDRCFISYDGSGRFCAEDGTFGPYVKFDIKWLQNNRESFKYIIWYNK